LAVVLSCIDSRAPAELIFDLGLGDIFNVRIAGNITSGKILGSVEYASAVAGAKLIVVMGHTRCGAVTAAVNLFGKPQTTAEVTGCEHLEPIIREIQQSVDSPANQDLEQLSAAEKESFVNAVARRNILHAVAAMSQQSQTLERLVQEGRIAIVGAMYDVVTGGIEFLTDAA
jgi:carbonic anhydrase/SulP family sulfate permease